MEWDGAARRLGLRLPDPVCEDAGELRSRSGVSSLRDQKIGSEHSPEANIYRFLLLC
jgi:hypothetical protein